MEKEATLRTRVALTKVERVVASLAKMQCVPWRALQHGPALQGLAAVGNGQAPEVKASPERVTLAEQEALLHSAGCALLERAALLKGQLVRAELLEALQFLSFRCFCAVRMLNQAASGESADAVPDGDAVWGCIREAWGSVRDEGKSVEGALADLTRWWLEHKKRIVLVPDTVDLETHGGDKTDFATYVGKLREQATRFQAAAADDLQSAFTAERLTTAADAVEELRQLLGAASQVSHRHMHLTLGMDLAEWLESKNSTDKSVYMSSRELKSVEVEDVTCVDEWAEEIASSARALAKSVAAAKHAEASRLAHGLPRVSQAPHHVSVVHIASGSSDVEPLGLSSAFDLQVQCEKGWPLSMFVRDAAWSDVRADVKQQLCLKVLGACAVAEACGVSLHKLSAGSFVVVGVLSASVPELVESLERGTCEVLLGACGRALGEGDFEGACLGGGGLGVLGVLRAVLGQAGEAAEGSTLAEVGFASHADGGDLALSSALEALKGKEGACCVEAWTLAYGVLGCRAGHLSESDSLVQQWAQRNPTAAASEELLAWVLARAPEPSAFTAACGSGEVENVRELLSLTDAEAVDVHAADVDGPESAFRAACAGGHLEVVKVLLALKDAQAVDVHAPDGDGPEAAFRAACAGGHEEVVRSLVSLTEARAVDVHAADAGGPDAAFRLAFSAGHVEVMRALLALTGSRKISQT